MSNDIVRTQKDNLCVLHSISNLTGVSVDHLLKYFPQEQLDLFLTEGVTIPEASVIVPYVAEAYLLFLDLDHFGPVERAKAISRLHKMYPNCLLFGPRIGSGEYHCLAYKNGKYLEANRVEINTLPIIVDGIGCLVPLTQ